MDKKKLDLFDATTEEEIEGVWSADLLYNSTVVGTVFGQTQREIKKYIKRWVSQIPQN